jgi:ABC-type glutathione transport system ATPase component
MSSTPLLKVTNLTLRLANGESLVEGAGFSIDAGEIVGIVGESDAALNPAH